jgi:alanine dehydrogenase
MDIGIAGENRPFEKRVVLLPSDLAAISAVHRVYLEQGAGEGIGASDRDYEQAGVAVVDRQTVYRCPLVVRLKEPKEEELAMMQPGAAIFSMLHLGGNPHLRQLIKKCKVTAIAMEEIKDALGRRRIEALHQSGYLGMAKGFELWGGDPGQSLVKIMGYGNVAGGAIQCAAREFARVVILHKRDFKDMSEHIPGTDILVNAINWPYHRRGKEFVITRPMLKLFKKGAVIVDLISNPPGQSPIETMHPTTLGDIAYQTDGVIHTACWGWPGLDPVNISRRYSKQVAPVLKDIADNGREHLPEYIARAIQRGEDN